VLYIDRDCLVVVAVVGVVRMLRFIRNCCHSLINIYSISFDNLKKYYSTVQYSTGPGHQSNQSFDKE
jgi:hypothetical protein